MSTKQFILGGDQMVLKLFTYEAMLDPENDALPARNYFFLVAAHDGFGAQGLLNAFFEGGRLHGHALSHEVRDYNVKFIGMADESMTYAQIVKAMCCVPSFP